MSGMGRSALGDADTNVRPTTCTNSTPTGAVDWLLLSADLWQLIMERCAARVPVVLAMLRRTCRSLSALANQPHMWACACAAQGWPLAHASPPQYVSLYSLRMGVRVDVRRAARECMRAGSLTSAVRSMRVHYDCVRGAPQRAIEAFERSAGVELPMDLREAFRDMNGQHPGGKPLLPGGFRMLGLEEILQYMLTRSVAELAEEAMHSQTGIIMLPLSEHKGFQRIVTFVEPLGHDTMEAHDTNAGTCEQTRGAHADGAAVRSWSPMHADADVRGWFPRPCAAVVYIQAGVVVLRKASNWPQFLRNDGERRGILTDV